MIPSLTFGEYRQYLGMIKKYGQQTVDLLIISKNKANKISNIEYKILIKHYQQEVKRLLKEKNL